jgi:septal ring factor EnvC (AmiA/AmiB activator)
MPLARARRNMEVFDIAIVAVVTKALGAFIVLMIFLLPYYKSDPASGEAVRAAEDYLGETKSAIDAVQRALRGPTPDRAALDELFGKARESLEKAQGVIQGIRDKLDQAKAQIDRLEARERELEQETGRLASDLRQAREQIARLQAERDALQRSNERLTADNSRLRAVEESLQNENRSLQERLRAMQEQLAAAADLRSQYDSLQQRFAADERELEPLRQQNRELQSEIAELKVKMESLLERARRTEDPSLVMRWFSVGLAIPGCSDIDFALYVRWEGPLRNAQTGTDMPRAAQFIASHPEQRTPLLGHRYFDLGARNDAAALSEKAFAQEGFAALANTRTQIKVFQAVSRVEGDYSVYVAAKDPRAFQQRQCVVHPYFLTWSGATLGQKVVLTQKRPFAWLRRLRINKDGTNTLATAPRDDEQFQSDLDEFSKAQSEILCDERKICGTEDAHRFALQAQQRTPRTP